MKTSKHGIDLVKRFEGCRLTAYKPVATEKYYTIGFGHYGADVTPTMKITQAQADAFLIADLKKFEEAVSATKLALTQCQFDALVSFAYNCGSGNLKKLVKGRSVLQIADALLAYNKAGGKVLAGLTRRRQAERTLFLTGIETRACPYPEPNTAVKYGSKGDAVRWVQWMLKYAAGYNDVQVDGIAGIKTASAIMEMQKAHGLVFDGIVGQRTREKLKELFKQKNVQST